MRCLSSPTFIALVWMRCDAMRCDAVLSSLPDLSLSLSLSPPSPPPPLSDQSKTNLDVAVDNAFGVGEGLRGVRMSGSVGAMRCYALSFHFLCLRAKRGGSRALPDPSFSSLSKDGHAILTSAKRVL